MFMSKFNIVSILDQHLTSAWRSLMNYSGEYDQEKNNISF